VEEADRDHGKPHAEEDDAHPKRQVGRQFDAAHLGANNEAGDD
jgi:hypothetical protein